MYHTASNDYAHPRFRLMQENLPSFNVFGAKIGSPPLIVLSFQVVRETQAADCSDREYFSHDFSCVPWHLLCGDVAPLMEPNWDMGASRSLKMRFFSCITPSGRAHEAHCASPQRTRQYKLFMCFHIWGLTTADPGIETVNATARVPRGVRQTVTDRQTPRVPPQ